MVDSDQGAREEVYNIRLADLLKDHGLITAPERIKYIGKKRKLPDIVLTDIHGVTTIIEGKVFTGKPAKTSVEDDAKNRISDGSCLICMAILYPKEIRHCQSDEEIKNFLREAEYQIKLFAAHNKHDPNWQKADLKNLTNLLNRISEEIINDEDLRSTEERVEQVLMECEEKFVPNDVVREKILKLLGV